MQAANIQFTPEQVVRGVEYFASKYLEEPFVLKLDEPLHVHFDTLSSQEICPLMFLEELAVYFGFGLSERRVLGWLKVRESKTNTSVRCGKVVGAPETTRTGNDLVRMIIRHSQCPDFSAYKILGQSCQKAGCFLGIQALVARRTRFSPSTRLRDIVSSPQYDELIGRLSWMLGCDIDNTAKRETSTVGQYRLVAGADCDADQRGRLLLRQ